MLMMLSIPHHGPFYALVLLLGLFQFIQVLQVSSNDSTNSPYLPLFTTACSMVALLTFIWSFVLLGYGSSETDNKSILTRCDTHITSFGLISFLWLCLCVFLTISAKNGCDRLTIICQQLSYCAIRAFLMFLSALGSAAIVTYSVTVADLPYSSHVERARERALELILDRRTRRQRSRTNIDQPHGQDIPMSDLSPTRPPLVYAAGRARPALPV